jgi:hypothetical protein
MKISHKLRLIGAPGENGIDPRRRNTSSRRAA